MPNTYQALFRQEVVITNISGKKIPLVGYLRFSEVAIAAVGTVVFGVLNITPVGFVTVGLLQAAVQFVAGNHQFVINVWIAGFVEAAILAFLSRRINPAGKSLHKYLLDGARYMFRRHQTDGFRPVPGKRTHRPRVRVQAASTQVDVPLPARIGVVASGQLHIHGPVTVRSQKDGTWIFPAMRGEMTTFPGLYEVKRGQLVRRGGAARVE